MSKRKIKKNFFFFFFVFLLDSKKETKEKKEKRKNEDRIFNSQGRKGMAKLEQFEIRYTSGLYWLELNSKTAVDSDSPTYSTVKL